jgi:hypothetical protein
MTPDASYPAPIPQKRARLECEHIQTIRTPFPLFVNLSERSRHALPCTEAPGRYLPGTRSQRASR